VFAAGVKMDTQHLSDQLSEAVNLVLQDLKSKYKQLQHTDSLMDMLRGFAAAINWEVWTDQHIMALHCNRLCKQL
jgi:hypothetical protein